MFSFFKTMLLPVICFTFLLAATANAVELPQGPSSQVVQEKEPAIPKNLPKELFDDTPLIPTQVFDNLYSIGTRSVAAWALKTSEGIILIDSMWDNHDAQLIIEGLEQLGLNPAEIKYVVITHGHGDHYGGAQFIKDKYQAQILMNNTDYSFMNSQNSGPNGARSPKPSVDAFVKDGDKITLGDTTVTVIETPGHTPGTISLLFPVRQDGVSYMAAQWGGTGVPQTLDAKIAYKKSIDYFETYTKAAHVSVGITSHLFSDNGYQKLDIVRNRKAGENNPFIIGEEGFSNYLNDLRYFIDKEIEAQ
ncbi:MBL fold metallo-hydrolase [Anaerospora hongkongensis]|uniref:MBL fold metallo-hydrolase n=1 Tax=Anaerospora hongkongensis TaxID=244830 RepID=UPI002897599C|nr:MBL fold metallo-hydrolase [Anaerospora hongkongensis]